MIRVRLSKLHLLLPVLLIIGLLLGLYSFATAEEKRGDKERQMKTDPTESGMMKGTQAGSRIAQEDKRTRSTPLTRRSGLVDRAVIVSRGDEVGEVKNILVDDSGKVFAVLEIGGFLDIGDKEVIVPLDSLEIPEEEPFSKTMTEYLGWPLQQVSGIRRPLAWLLRSTGLKLPLSSAC
jgi:hypothetical protein